MTEETQITEQGEQGATTGESGATEDHVPYERFKQVNSKLKRAESQGERLQQQITDLQQQMQEREQAGLPELDKLKQRLEAAEQRAKEADARASEADTKLARTVKERLVVAAAKDFADPGDAVAFVNLDEVDDERDAERAVKALAKRKPHLLRAEEAKLPGKVLEDGRAVRAGQAGQGQQQGPDLLAEAEMISQGLKDLLASRQG